LWAGWAHTHTTAPTVHEYATHRGERRELGLPDGSHVVLGAESKLWIATSRFTRERTLRLEGLAYFRVAPDASHPFVVLTRTSATQAVGTAFTVKAYPEDSLVQVAVTHGRVLLRPVAAALGTGTALQRGDLGQLDAGDVTSVMHDADVESFASWTSGRLTYDLVPLRSVVRDLERWYDLAITVDDPALGDARLTVAIDPRRPPSEALARVAEALNAHYELTGRVAHFRP
ncbi:MAG: FecR domain-containing protein, partial [Gemmatimonadaceae bacterium]|nr:FecR domain-containing protein [Gemmatimonadaceae bacterium]